MSQVKNCCCLVDLSGIGGPTSSYATAGITFRSIWPHKPHHHKKPWGGGYLNLWWWNSNINFVFLNRHSLFYYITMYMFIVSDLQNFLLINTYHYSNSLSSYVYHKIWFLNPFRMSAMHLHVTVGAVHGWVPYKYDFCCKQPGQVPYTLKFCDIFMRPVTNMHAAHCTGTLFFVYLE